MSILNAKILAVAMLIFGAAVLASTTDVHLPGNHQGYEPVQPIAYSHRLHAGELGIDCMFCHYGAETSRHAGIPPTSVCMTCHRTITAGFDAILRERQAAELEGREPETVVSAELRKLYDAAGLGPDLTVDPDVSPTPIPWVRVHNVPDFVYFDHRVHVTRGVACETCHGPVQSMERVRQFASLSMGWCMSCHRDSPAVLGAPADGRQDHVSTDCSACHY